MITNQRELRAAFWRDNPGADRRTIPDYSGQGRMFRTDTRVAWCDYLDSLQRSGVISADLADRATLAPVHRVYAWEVQGNYGPHGWETECTESTRAEALQRLREYRANGPGAYRIRRIIERGAK
jgi:hypothetical protein